MIPEICFVPISEFSRVSLYVYVEREGIEWKTTTNATFIAKYLFHLLRMSYKMTQSQKMWQILQVYFSSNVSSHLKPRYQG